MTMFDTTIGNKVSRPSETSFLKKILSLSALQKQRSDLANLSPEQLDDIGVSPKAASSEAKKPIWDVPANWRG